MADTPSATHHQASRPSRADQAQHASKDTSPGHQCTTTARPARPTTGQRYPAFAGPAVTIEGDTLSNMGDADEQAG